MSLSACAMDNQTNYTVTCPAGADVNNTMAYLVDWDSAQKIDSAVVTDGVIEFKGHVESPFIGRIIINGARGPVFFVEKGNVTIGSDRSLSGTPLNDKFATYQEAMDSIVNEYNKLSRNDSTSMAMAMELREKYDSIPAKAYAENKDNVLGLYFYMQDAFDKPLSQLEADMSANPVLSSSKQAQALANTLRTQAATGEGSHYKDFTVDYDGKSEKLSTYVKPGRFTIVDFWACWCGPCVRQLKVIKELYAKYKDKGLDVVGVAVWDKPEDTLEAIKKHELPWPCIINAQTVPTDLYGIQGIPCIMLISPEGIIVSRDKQGEELIKAVDEAMSAYELPETQEPVKSVPAKTIASSDTVAIF